MKIINFEIYRYSLPLSRPLVLEGKEQRFREGILLFIQGDNHLTGLGEIAPLPGFSTERLQDAEKQLFFLRDKVLNNKIPDDVGLLTWHFETWVRSWKLFPSVRCGFELAVLDLLARTQKMTLRQSIAADAVNHVPASVLLAHKTQKLLQRETSQALRQGVWSFKLKVGASDITVDLARVGWVHEVLESGSSLHLDANRQWEYGQAFNFVKRLDSRQIEYFEEPTRDTERLEEFSRITQCPLALDETLREWSPEGVGKVTTLQAVVLKPMLLGGWEKTMGWVRHAKKKGWRVVISSSFESAVGISALAELACAVAPQEAAGLDTGKWFEKDLLPRPFEVKEGNVFPGSFDFEKADLDFQLIRAVNED